MKTTTYAQVALLVGPFTQEDVTEVPSRGEKGLEFLKEKYGDSLVAFVFFDIKETEFQGLKFTSEPHHQERVDVMKKEDFEKRINAEREQLSEVISATIDKIEEIAERAQENAPDLTEARETIIRAKRTLH